MTEQLNSLEVSRLVKPKGPDYSHVTPEHANYQREWLNCMDDARLEVDYGSLKDSFVNWAMITRPEEELAHWRALDPWQYATIGKMTWGMDHGAIMPDQYIPWFENKITELLNIETVIDDSEFEPKLSMTQKRIVEYTGLYSSMEAIWWKFKSNTDEIETRITKLLKIAEPNQQMLKKLYEHFKDSFNDAMRDKANEFSAAKIEPLITVVNLLATSTGNAKAIRDSRGATTKSVKQASKVKLKTVDMDTGVASLSPAMIPGSKLAVIYNAKDRKVTVYYAKSDSVLSIKNTKIVDFDETRSFAKTLRKPNDILPSLRNAVTTRRIDVVFADINGKNHEVNGRMSKDMLLLKVFK
jgi:hypothetical protein